MRPSKTILLNGTVSLIAAPAAATAGQLSVVTVSAPAVNCVFETDCTVTVTDSVGKIPLPNLTSGEARLQTRTFPGKPPAPAGGKTGYEYRVDLTTAVTNIDFSCVTDLAVDFGPVTKLQYNNVPPTDDVYVVTHGGLGKIGILTAEQNGSLITFTFSQPVCAGQSPNAGNSTFFFGLTSAFGPHAITAKVGVPGLLPVDVSARGPNHLPSPERSERPDAPAHPADQTETSPKQ